MADGNVTRLPLVSKNWRQTRVNQFSRQSPALHHLHLPRDKRGRLVDWPLISTRLALHTAPVTPHRYCLRSLLPQQTITRPRQSLSPPILSLSSTPPATQSPGQPSESVVQGRTLPAPSPSCSGLPPLLVAYFHL
ncbi:hypothetical protein E2C01_027630 [Portunus trituberculatus]|uniref:Uncharacterized protein n=1 Tax=Portunus trituberculatus TaxID=210409 RepID=A0A5B7ELU2_PORTR|nr:hypothetical protein [Portunus trituberculatus]